MLRAQVRRVCFRGDLLHRQLVVADRLLETQGLNFNVLCFAQARSDYCGQCCTGVNVQPNRNDSTMSLANASTSIDSVAARLPAHSSASAALVATMLRCFVQTLIRFFPCKIMPTLTDFLDCLSPAQVRVSKGVQSTWMSLPLDTQPVAFQRETVPLSSCSSSLVRPAETSLSTASWWRT